MANRNKKMVYHIYWGTAGNAGLYLDEIYQVLHKAGYRQKAFVNYYYPFDYGEKVFYKLTELGHCKIKRFRGPIRYLELFWAILRILINTIVDRPKVINYSIIGSFDIVSYYLKFCQKILGCKIVLTCHDVIPFASASQAMETEMNNRRKVLAIADYLLVHNEYSKSQLVDCFGVDSKKIVMHPFPVMDLSKLIKDMDCRTTKTDFLFIGHLRREKGVDVLLNAWELVHMEYPQATLRVAGNLPSIENLSLSQYEGRSDVEFILKFLSDKEYCSLIKSTRYVVLPYKNGTNSGVVSTVLSLDSEVIASDIPMFEQNPMIDKSLLFKSEDEKSLSITMIKAFLKSDNNSCNSQSIIQYRTMFEKTVLDVYNIITSLK